MSDTNAPLRIHDVTGVNVLVNGPRFIATRKAGFTCNAYVFTSRPVRIAEKIAIQILDLDMNQQHSLTFGMTSCDPDDIRPHRLPNDPDELVERVEYWVVCKDIVSDLAQNDQLTFHISDKGQLISCRNGQTLSLEIFVDQSVPLWAFCDLSGNTRKIELKSIPPIKASPSDTSLHTSELLFTTMMMGISAAQKKGIPTPFMSALSSAAVRPDKVGTTPSATAIATIGNGTGLPQVAKRSRPPVPPRPQNAGRMPSPNKCDTTTTSLNKPQTAVAIGAKYSQTADRDECVICMDNSPNCVLYTCGHMCLCYECAVDLRKEEEALCPICRNKITDIIKVFK